MSAQPEQRTFRYITRNVPAAIASARRSMRLMGWARTSLVKLTRMPAGYTGPSPAYEKLEITIKGAGSRVAGWTPDQFPALEERQARKGLRKGMAVRTLSAGFNFAAGAHHTMPAGVVGVVVGLNGIVVRVRFAEIPGHSFGYAPSALEVLP